MKSLTDLPNIGKTLAEKLISVGISTPEELENLGSENAIIRIDSLANSGACINMLYAMEGAIQGVRWHGLNNNRKIELKAFYYSLIKDKGND